ncbi:MAG: hypothetical protein GY789_00445 [Hyphomicrobiales bacterium]|nr:hypothetical protein [Hyphomicrobiales bacterium]
MTALPASSQFNLTAPYLEMIEGRVHDIHWVGHKAVEMGDLMMEFLFIPIIQE